MKKKKIIKNSQIYHWEFYASPLGKTYGLSLGMPLFISSNYKFEKRPLMTQLQNRTEQNKNITTFIVYEK